MKVIRKVGLDNLRIIVLAADVGNLFFFHPIPSQSMI
jgi:hypothetical protein